MFMGSDSILRLMSDLSNPLASQGQQKPSIEVDDLPFHLGDLLV
jgi:hypothetical protein